MPSRNLKIAKPERERLLHRWHYCVEVICKYLEKIIAEERERQRKREICGHVDIYKCRPKFKGRCKERSEGLDLEALYLLHRLFKADLEYTSGISSNSKFFSLQRKALALKASLAEQLARKKKRLSELVEDCLFHITALVVDAGGDQNKIGFSIDYLSKLKGSLGIQRNLIVPKEGEGKRFRGMINNINKNYFYGKYDLMNYLKTLASGFRPKVERLAFRKLLYYGTPARAGIRWSRRRGVSSNPLPTHKYP